jgi:hypothetical protein
MKTPPTKSNSSIALTPNDAVTMVSNAINLKIMITNIDGLLAETAEEIRDWYLEEEPNNVYFINRKFDVEYERYLEKDIFKKNPGEVISQFHKWTRELETIIISNKELIAKSKILKETFSEQLTKVSLILYLVDEIEENLMKHEEDISPNQ